MARRGSEGIAAIFALRSKFPFHCYWNPNIGKDTGCSNPKLPMKTKYRLLAALSGLFLAALSFAQQVPIATKPADVTAADSGVIMHPEYAKTVGRMAYVWGWPMVNQMNRRAAITQAPEPGRLNGVLPVAPRGQTGMLNDYIDPGRKLRHLPESGRRLRARVLLSRR